ncbi:MAG TPA: gamma-glutamyl-gamma-aminobutyrate hydrolase family protein, partial [Candidatus Sumerlaeota bacterium]|nr:gamma-glutamyl-gamma-aminobutyrate hydrolase family protein [Candidatus Sumerlaeota bacterium]
MKPLIGINAGAVPEEEGRHHYYLSGRYTNAVTAAGGIPLILPATPDLSFVQRYLDSVQGLILTGGPDVDPALYGENDKLATVKPASALRLNFDLALARAAVERNMPVFGICMGCQVLNVAGGGTLFQDVEFQIPSHAVPHYKRVAPHYTFHHV